MKTTSKVYTWSRWLGLVFISTLLIGACTPAAAPTPVPTKAPPVAAPVSSTSITGIVWQWISLTDAGQTTTIPDPANYTITFNTDGTVTGKADCNTFSGTYSTQNGFTIKVTPNVMSACGTLDSQYLTLLNQVAAGGPDGAGGLALETAGGAQRLMFKNGGAASAAPPPPAPTQPAASSITNILWSWTNVTDKTANTTLMVPNSQNYTIVFKTDGTLTGQADCNSFSGTYSQANGFTIKLGATTTAACGEGSLSQQYLNLLSSVAAGGPDGAGGLVLQTAGGAQSLLFRNAGTAP
ncbi:MAG TPA: META domain-containing protein [Anaerolineae bacterium]|nr:META domain-containing protein [Anaerolineae bacterium]